MSVAPGDAGGKGPSHRLVEIVVAAFTGLMAAVAIAGSLRVGIGWGLEGPRAGFFPFYVGLLICLSTGVVIARALADKAKAAKTFVTRTALKQVLWMLVPSVVYVVLIRPLGLYVASTLFIAFFMRRLGRYPWVTTVAVAAGVSVLFFLLFEVWFKLPLPKGPLEAWLKLD